MLTLKVGTFPGEIKEVAVPNGATVQEILQIAGVSFGAESSAQLDGNEVALGEQVYGGSMLIVTKRLKSGR